MTVDVAGLSLEQRTERLQTMVAEGLICRGSWRDDLNGQERVCLLVAWAPEVEDSSQQCPAEVLPPWAAELLVIIDDDTSFDKWPGFLSRVAQVVPKIANMSHDHQTRLGFATMATIIETYVKIRFRGCLKESVKRYSDLAKSLSKLSTGGVMDDRLLIDTSYSYGSLASSVERICRGFMQTARLEEVDYLVYSVCQRTIEYDCVTRAILDLWEKWSAE